MEMENLSHLLCLQWVMNISKEGRMLALSRPTYLLNYEYVHKAGLEKCVSFWIYFCKIVPNDYVGQTGKLAAVLQLLLIPMQTPGISSHICFWDAKNQVTVTTWCSGSVSAPPLVVCEHGELCNPSMCLFLHLWIRNNSINYFISFWGDLTS